MSLADRCRIETGVTKADLESVTPPEGITRENAHEVIRNLNKAIKDRTYVGLMDVQANAYAGDIVLRMINDHGVKPKDAVRALLVRDLRDRSVNVSVDHLVHGYQMSWSGVLDEVAQEFAPSVTGGVRNRELLQDSLRVMLGGQARNGQANRLGTAMKQALDTAHNDMKRVGIDIGHLNNYFPQKHVAAKLRKVPEEQWVAELFDMVDRQRMRNKDGEVLNDADLREVLSYVYRSITTQGGHKVAGRLPKIMGRHFSTSMGRRNGMSRIIHFKDADTFLNYNAKYGDPDLWGTFTNKLHNMAADTSLATVFGPNIEDGFKRWKRWAQQQDKTFDGTSLDALWQNIVGFEHSADVPAANIVAGARDLLSSAYMGSAVVSSISDLTLVSLNSAYNGMNMLAPFMHALDGGRTNKAVLARTVGMIEWANSSLALNPRYEDSFGAGLTRRWADANYRVSGMTGWMNRLRQGWMMENQLFWGRHRNKTFDNLPSELQRFFRTYGLENQWDTIRALPVEDFKGGHLLKIVDLEDPALKAKVLGAINTERDLAVLTPDARTRAVLNQGHPTGTAAGELFRSSTQFMTFPVSMLMHTVGRYAFSSKLSSGSRIGYIGALAFGMTMLGAVSVQLKEILRGRDPRDMEDEKFWAKAFIQGGATPLIADFILAENRFTGGGRAEALLGPAGGLAISGFDLAQGTVETFLGLDGGEEKAGRSLEEISRATPFGSLWYGRLIMDRMIRDAALSAVDPNYADRQREKERNLRNRYDQDTWWGYED